MCIWKYIAFFSDPQKKDLPETKRDQETVTEHPMTKTGAPEKNPLKSEIAKTGSVPTKVLMADQKTGEAQKSVKQGKYNLAVHSLDPLASYGVAYCGLVYSYSKGHQWAVPHTDPTRVDVQCIKMVIMKSELTPFNWWQLKQCPFPSPPFPSSKLVKHFQKSFFKKKFYVPGCKSQCSILLFQYKL